MATDVLLVREGSKLGAADPISAETISSLKHGEMVTCTIRRARNPYHHRKLFALLNAVFENQDRYLDLEDLLDAVKIGVGHYTLATLPGKIPLQIVKPKSISFAAMGQDKFEKFFDKAVDFILIEILPGTDREDLEQRIFDILEGNRKTTPLREGPYYSEDETPPF